VSTGTTEALVHASQGEVARGAQVQGNRALQGAHGKPGSAGFAQILGEQVATSATKTPIAVKAGEQPVPKADAERAVASAASLRLAPVKPSQSFAKAMGQSESPAKQTVATDPERVMRDDVRPVQPKEPVRVPGPASAGEGQPAPTRLHANAQIPVPTIEAVRGQTRSPSPATNNDRPESVPAKAGENTPQVSTKASEGATSVPAKTGEASFHAPTPTNYTPAHVKSTAGGSVTGSPSLTLPTNLSAGTSKPTFTPAPTGHGAEIPVTTAHSALGGTTAPGQARPVPQVPDLPPAKIGKDSARVAQEPPTQGLPHPVLATAPSVAAHPIHRSAPVVLTQTPPAPTEDGSASVHSPAHADNHAVAPGSPAHEHQPQTRSVGPQVIPVAQAVPPPIPQPGPATIAQDNATPRLPQHSTPLSAPETSRPIATARTTARAPIAKPTDERPNIPEETGPRQPLSDTKTPKSTANRSATSTEDAERATTTDKPSIASPKQSPASHVVDAGQVGNKRAVPIEASANKRRAHVEDEKEAEETQAPAQSSLVSPLPSLSSSSAGIEFKAPKPETPASSQPKTTGENSSQTNNTQSTSAQLHTMKEEFRPAILTPAERPTVFVPQSAFLPASHESVREATAPSSIAVERAGLVDRAIDDPGLSVTVMPHSAHLSITGDTGDLALHVRVRDGSADVNVSGSMAPLFDSKAPEVRTALAGEGLQLGSFATDQRGSSQGQQGQPESTPRTNDLQPPPPPRRATTATPEVHISNDRRIHVTA
jgi:hypothetical protein